MTYDASNTKDVRRAEKASRLADLQRREVVASLTSTAAGRRYVWDRLAALHVFTTSYSDIPSRMAFLEGERNAGLQLLDDLMQFCPDQFLEMIREANNRQSEQAELQPTESDEPTEPKPETE